MNRKNLYFYIVSCIIFVACAFIGFIITREIKPNERVENSARPNDEPSTDDTVGGIIEVPDTSKDSIRENPKSPEIEENIPSQQTQIHEKEKLKPRITKEQLTSNINSLHNQNYPRNVRLRYNNLDTENGEENLTSISLIRQYIKTGIWKGVTVTDVEYDENNNVTSITMTIIR